MEARTLGGTGRFRGAGTGPESVAAGGGLAVAVNGGGLAVATNGGGLAVAVNDGLDFPLDGVSGLRTETVLGGDGWSEHLAGYVEDPGNE